MEDEHQPDHDIDHAEFNLPEGRFKVTGARNGKLSLCIGIAIVIMAFGFAIAHVLDALE